MEILNALTYLEENGKAVGKKASEGDKLSRDIIETYTLVHTNPSDSRARDLLQAYVETYKKRELENEKAAANSVVVRGEGLPSKPTGNGV
jgi:hypothetical protein